MGNFLGIDAGTSGLRACIINDQQQLLAESTLPLPGSTINGDKVEQQPADWWQTCCDVLDELFRNVDPSTINALAIAGTSSTSLLCDDNGHVQTPALMYNDQRARAQAQWLIEKLPADFSSSAVQGANSSLAKLLWFIDSQQVNSSSRFRHQADWLTGHFLNNYSFCDENNALKLGYNAVSRQWPSWFEALKLPTGLLPTVKPAGACLGTVCDSIQERFGLPQSCLIAAGTTDSTAACLAAGITKPGEAVTVLGSTLVVKILSKRPVFAPGHGLYSHRLGDLWLVGGASNSGGAVLKQYFDDDMLASLSQEINPDRDSGLDYYPLPATGERFPFNDPDLEPRLSPRPGANNHFLHGLLEGIARIEAQAYQKLIVLGAPAPLSIRTIGGGAKNKTWQRMRERITGIPMKKAQHGQPACGAALLALQCHQSDSKD